MKIAFDVQGTLDGPKGEVLKKLLELFIKEGHEVVIWSSSLTMAKEMASKLNSSCPYMRKVWSHDYHSPEDFMDIAFDDDSTLKLLAHKTYYVQSLPNDLEELKVLFKLT